MKKEHVIVTDGNATKYNVDGSPVDVTYIRETNTFL